MSISPNILEPIIGPSIEQIISELEIIFPPTNPSPNESIETIMFKAGQRDVVEWIKTRIKEDPNG
tara:strand:- start:3272 stop:3466 length:195 start_codon:yes stop_codon:yes gene_type:complete